MGNLLFYIFVVLVILIPFLYRIVRTGSITFFKNSTDFASDLNYQKAEKIRIIQVLIGFIYLVFHGSIFWGWLNIGLFIFITFSISLIIEIIGSKTGLIFGGKYNYNSNLTPGRTVLNVPVLIPIAWIILTYMSFNLYCLISGLGPEIILNKTSNVYIVPCLILMFLDMILDPIAVNEGRWSWNNKFRYYDVPLMNFVGWFITSFLVFFVFSKVSFPTVLEERAPDIVQYAPGLLFIFVQLIAVRPCIERNLKLPAILGMILSLFYILIILTNTYSV